MKPLECLQEPPMELIVGKRTLLIRDMPTYPLDSKLLHHINGLLGRAVQYWDFAS